jgi:hypothetical protein
MRTSSELEKLIVTELREVKGLEESLDRGFAVLGFASPRARVTFLMGLIDLEARTRGLEQLIDSLNENNQTAQGRALELGKEGYDAANFAFDAVRLADRRASDMAV